MTKQIDDIEEQFGQGVLSDLFFRLLKRKPGLLPPQSRRLLSQIGNEKITSIQVVRTPLQRTLVRVLNVLSLGAFKRQLNKLNYSDAFHLHLFINNKYDWQKNEVLRLTSASPIKKGSEILNIPIPSGFSMTIEEMINKTRERMGDRTFSEYNAKTNNCQDLVLNTLQAMGLGDQKIFDFIKQDAVSIFAGMPAFVERWGKTLTDIAAVGSRLIEGQSIEGGCCDKGCDKEKTIIKKNNPIVKDMNRLDVLKGSGIVKKGTTDAKLQEVVDAILAQEKPRGKGLSSKKAEQIAEEVVEKVSKGKGLSSKKVKEIAEEAVEKVSKGKGLSSKKAKDIAEEAVEKVSGGGKRSPSKWLLALKQWNSKHGGTYTVPKKGTKEYMEVRKIMEQM